MTEDLVDNLHKQALREAEKREEAATKDMAIAKSLRARVAFINYAWDLAVSLAEEAAKLDPKFSQQAFEYRKEYNRIFKPDLKELMKERDETFHQLKEQVVFVKEKYWERVDGRYCPGFQEEMDKIDQLNEKCGCLNYEIKQLLGSTNQEENKGGLSEFIRRLLGRLKD